MPTAKLMFVAVLAVVGLMTATASTDEGDGKRTPAGRRGNRKGSECHIMYLSVYRLPTQMNTAFYTT